MGSGSPGSSTDSAGASASSAPPQDLTAACPLVDPALLKSNFDVADPQLTEKEPTKTGPVTTSACDIAEGGELFLTAGVSVGPPSGTVSQKV